MRGIVQSNSRIFLFHIFAIIVIGLVVSYAIVSPPESPKVQSEKGVLDLSKVDVGVNLLKLEGEWEFYWKELLSPKDISNYLEGNGDQVDLITLPNSWKGYQLDGKELGSTGFATYRLVIKLNEKNKNERLALRIPSIFHSYKLWVNGEIMSEVGVVGQDRSNVKPFLATKLVFFHPNDDTVELVIQVSNFHHNRGGITKPIELGGSDAITAKVHKKITTEMCVTTSLILIGVFHLVLYAMRRKDRAPLYFGLFILLIGIRSMLVGELLITQLIPSFPWGIQFKIEYLILCSVGYLILKYYEIIFPNYVSRWFHLSAKIIMGALCLIILMTPAFIYTKLLVIIGAIVALQMVYLIIGLVQAAIKQKEQALYFLLVSTVTLVTVINDFLYYNEWSRIGNTSSIGLLVFTGAQMFLLSSRFTNASSNEGKFASKLQDANNKLTELNMNLEKTVQERTQALSVAHDDLHISYDRLLRSEEGRKKLLAYITHDLRKPLSSMLGYVELVQDKIKPENNEQYLKYIRDNTIRITRMIEELSYLSHLETEQISYQMESISPIKFISEFYGQYELVVHDAGVDFKLDIEIQHTNLLTIEADTNKLEQALFNLVSNAIKFTPTGGVIRISLSEEMINDTPYVLFSVKDTGTGIPLYQLERIFERNYSFDQSGAREGMEGSGLGLAICKEIMEAHGGSIRAESDGKTGASFYVMFPCIMSEGR